MHAADLLQISPEERRRVARSAALFTEEELSRFLAIMLRTFDELGYRQEQRFHLELGLLKLVHAQRLVPIEDLLSQLGVTNNSKPSTPPPASSPRVPATASSPAIRSAPPPTSSFASANPASAETAPAAPRPSPFEADRGRKLPGTPAPAAVESPMRVGSHDASAPAQTEGALALASQPGLTPVEGPRLVPFEQVQAEPQVDPGTAAPELAPADESELPAEPLTITASAAAEPVSSGSGPDLDTLQAAMVATLAATKGQQSASEQLEDATFALNNGALEIQTTLSPTMLPVVLNADSERILKNVLREQGHGTLRLRFLPGTATDANSAARKPRSAPAGSAKELAANHPVVQQAQRLFSAEIRNVVDLRKP